MNRRTFLASSSAALLAAPAAAGPPKRLAAILTEYWLGSHADVVIGKYLEGYNQDDKPPYPRSKIVAMFTEHVPKNDMSRPMAKKYGVPIFRRDVRGDLAGGLRGRHLRDDADLPETRCGGAVGDQPRAEPRRVSVRIRALRAGAGRAVSGRQPARLAGIRLARKESTYDST